MTQILDCPPSERKPAVVDLTAVKARQQATWASGDFSVIGTTLNIVGESLCEADKKSARLGRTLAAATSPGSTIARTRSRSPANLSEPPVTLLSHQPKTAASTAAASSVHAGDGM